jgi:hypothetical protein
MQVPHANEQVSAPADWVAVGVSIEAWRQRVFAESAADEQRRLRVEAQRLGERCARVVQSLDVIQTW